ncbi:hypothetical protein HK096_002056, partial [Nowakowskiella sp. JEL0078]
MLSAVLPFYDDDQYAMGNRIRKAEYKFGADSWNGISTEAKDLISKLLVANPSKRLTINQVFEHHWISSQIDILEKLYARVNKIEPKIPIASQKKY